MFTTFLKEVSGYFDRRFLLSAFFPSFLFASLNLAMVAAIQGTHTLVAWWEGQAAVVQASVFIGSLIFVLFVAYLLHIFQTSLTRLYEGYWEGIPILRWWGKARKRFYQEAWQHLRDEIKRLGNEVKEVETTVPLGETGSQRRDRLQKAKTLRSEMERLGREKFLFFPPDKAYVMPTRLGNVIRASEFYSLKRYDLDAVVAWPRLQSLLPTEFAESLRNAKANLDLFLVVTTLAALFTFGWEIWLFLFTGRWDLFLLVSAGWLLVLFGYFGAIQAGRSYGELIKAAFDLHRWELLKALHLKLPEGYAQEKALWREVSDLLYRNLPPKAEVYRYETEKTPMPRPEPSPLAAFLSQLAHKLGLIDEEAGER